MPFILSLLLLLTSSIAFQPITVPNRALVGHVYRSSYDIDWITCIQSCQDDPKCFSYNFARLLNGLSECQMIDCGLEDSCNTDGLVFSTGSIFQQIVPTGVRKIIFISVFLNFLQLWWRTNRNIIGLTVTRSEICFLSAVQIVLFTDWLRYTSTSKTQLMAQTASLGNRCLEGEKRHHHLDRSARI